MIPLLVFVAILVVVGLIIAGMYNGLVQLKVRADMPGLTLTFNSNAVTT